MSPTAVAVLAFLLAAVQMVVHDARAHRGDLPEGWRVAVRVLAAVGFIGLSAATMTHAPATGIAPWLAVTVLAAFVPRVVEEVSYERGTSKPASKTAQKFAA